MFTLDENSLDLKVAYPYFSSEALKFESEHSYADANATLINKTEYGWNHSFGEILNSLMAEGMAIEFLHEFPFCGWECLSEMERGDDGWRRLKDENKRKMVPLMFSLRARKRSSSG